LIFAPVPYFAPHIPSIH